MAVKIGHASIDENGKASGGKVGDQTGKEVCVRTWYPGSGTGWNVMLICTDEVVAKLAADYMKAICEDDDFGYDQGQRATGYLAIVNKNGKVSNAIPSEFDCSSLVASCYKLAGLNVNYQCTTRNLRKALLATGKFVEYTDSAHLKTEDYAAPGAVYLKEGSHVVMALDYGSKAKKTTSGNSVTTVNIAENEKAIWDFFKSKGLTDYAVAGLEGNLYAESGLSQINLQNTGNTKLGMTDAEYTVAVDNGTYTNFVKDSQGYGLAQWTYWSRKQNMYNFIKKKGKSIGDLTAQLEFLYHELSTSYKLQLEKINKATSVLEASNVILKEFERPANQGASVQEKRASYGENYYNKFASKQTTSTTPVPTPSTPTNNTGIVAGKQLNLKNVKAYTSESTKDSYGTKTGTFYLWDNVVKNNRIRITNAANRVGVAGQVTCWINVSDIGTTANTSAGSSATASPKYVVGKVYTLQTELKVRSDAGTNKAAKTHAQLTTDGKKHDKDKDGALDKGTQVTCQAVKTVGTDIWIKSPSGWMAAYYQGQYYIK
jgi:hypothetical protein